MEFILLFNCGQQEKVMKKINVNSLSPQSYFSEPVYLDKSYILLAPEIPVDQALINRLRKWDITQLYTEGVYIGKSEYKTTSDQETIDFNIEQDIKDKNAYEKIVKFYFDLLGFCKNMFTQYGNKGEIQIAPISEKMKKAIDYVKHYKDLILRFNELKYPTDNYI